MPRISLRHTKNDYEEQVQLFLLHLDIIVSQENFHWYTKAFVHRSVLNEASSGYTESNERLEYLGDAVIELIITEALFYHFPDKTEGELTDIRSALVRGRNLAQIAKNLGFSSVIQLSRGEFNAKGHENPYILANTFEALVGALYSDKGFDAAKDFVLKHVFTTLETILEKGLYVDPKSYLQELTQEIWGVIPVYSVASSE